MFDIDKIKVKLTNILNIINAKRNIAWLDSILLKSNPENLEYICSECLKKNIDFKLSHGVAYYEDIFFLQLRNYYSRTAQYENRNPDVDLSPILYTALKKIIDYKIPQNKLPFVKSETLPFNQTHDFQTMHYYIYNYFCFDQKRPKLEHIILSSLINYPENILFSLKKESQNFNNEKITLVINGMLDKAIALNEIYKIREQKRLDKNLNVSLL